MASGYDPQTVLQRVLVLERQQGFQDRAALGGLSVFARTQVARAGAAVASGLAAAADTLEGYGDRDRRGREMAVSKALHALLTGSGPLLTEAPAPSRNATTASSPRGREVPQPPAVPPSTRLKVTPPPRPKLSIVHNAAELDNPISSIKGLRKQASDGLLRCGVETIRDLLHYFPRTHYDYTDTRSISRMRLGVPMTLVGTIVNVRNNRTSRGTVITTATISDDTGTVAVRWFNQPYLQSNLPLHARIAITGEPEVNGGYIAFVPKDYELIENEDLTHAARLVPVYPLTKGLYQRSLRSLIKRIVDEYAGLLEDPLPPALTTSLQLTPLPEAIRLYHFPDNEETRRRAQQRLAFEELFLVQLGLLMRQRQGQEYHADVAVPVDEALLEQFCASLPFALTGAQRRVIASLLEDMSKPVPMSRLLQGDVGSGKTVVAAALLLQVIRGGKQGVLMAPTEILAEQHFRTLAMLLDPFGIRIELLIGSISRAKRRPVYEATRDGSIDLLVGTHALIQPTLEFHDLGIAITDEQHRFGVEQRATLRQKGLHPHTLAMTATPIPRTLAMTIYGDLDVSAIDEMPPGRMPVVTTWAQTPQEAYGVVRDEIRKGHQAFVICPVIEESMESDMRSVVAEHKELQSLVFPDLNVGLLHGRLKAAEKETVLAAFRNAEYDVLVATSVVEVGIDIPNATVMVIRDAHRFGLAQLHQFRGRVGRGGDQAFCVLLSTAEGDEARERLDALTATENGFELAEEDLRLRGPGEFWGTRQSGLPALKVATLGDVRTIELARRAAEDTISTDPDLSSPANAALNEAVRRFWSDGSDLS